MIRVLVVGAGAIAPHHINNIRRADDASLVGICDLDIERARSLAGEYGAAFFTDFEKAITSCKPDCLFLLTPRNVRQKVIEKCVDANLPIFIEKPPCHDMTTGRLIMNLLGESSLVHSVGFMHRYSDVLNHVLEQTDLDTLSAISISIVTPLVNEGNRHERGHLYKVDESGGIVGEVGIHYIDIVRYICRCEPREVAAFGSNRLLEPVNAMTTKDAACWQFEMENGVIASTTITWGGPCWSGVLEIADKDSHVFIQLMPPDTSKAWGILQGQPFEQLIMEDDRYLEVIAFLSAVQSGSMENIRSPYADALRSFELAGRINALLYGQTPELD